MRELWAFLVLSIWSLLLWSDHGFAKPVSQILAARQNRLSPSQEASHFPTPALLEHDKRSPGGFVSKLPGLGSDGPKYVFRGVRGMPPAEIKRRGGLLPNNGNPRSLSSDAYKLVHHLHDAKNVHGKDSAYVSTTTSFEVAAWFAQPGGYVYVIKTTPNMVPVESSVVPYPLRWEREYSALGGVVFEQIAECVQLPANMKPDFIDVVKAKDASKNMDQYRDLVKQGVLKSENSELQYDKKRFGKMSASAGQPQLAGHKAGAADWDKAPYDKLDRDKPTWEYAHEFMESIGAGQGWSDKFPLFQNPEHEAKIKADQKAKQERQQQQEQPALSTSEDVAPVEQESSTGMGLGEFLYDISPAKPFGDLVEAIRTDEPVSAGEWLGILGDIGLEVLAWTPTPAAVGVRALRFARTGYKASQAIKRGVDVARSATRVVKEARRISARLDAKLETVEVKVPTSPSTPPVTQPVARIAKIADKVKVPKTAAPASAEGASGSGLSPKKMDQLLEELQNLHVHDEPIVPVMMEVVKNAGKRVKLPKQPVPMLAERSALGSAGQSLADRLQEWAATKERGEKAPLKLLLDIIEGVNKKLGAGEGEQESFLDNDLLWGMFEAKFNNMTLEAEREPRHSVTMVG
ncbi:heat-labile enterotoxin alpha chain domain-containing protein [Hirsutella rhossiliensis]|uniref:Heat-labile enterotoxin alpha chain domain-containing protein n=1 Tax=Hirsutella rhossiliensis TaxID=111463 RepID=A0A9P8N3Q9_9HYPO|nr:heat-labile enterotoxin alpha chain domain-containing protein [Hirsutella rhossiliensis]KAH0965411.1 heat-labile enterotoxin alpha chain domain-containing protein [Hirsutella rhossiliensis]